MTAHRQKFGIVGGLGPLTGADIFFKLVKSTPAGSDSEHFDIVYEQHPFDDGHAFADENFNPNARKFYVYNTIRELQKRDVTAVILTCFISHTFLDEIQPEIKTPIVSIMEALRAHLGRDYPTVRKLGVLTSSYVRTRGLFERTFADDYELIYPNPSVQRTCLMEAIYGPRGIKAGRLRGESIELVLRACRDVIDQGAEIIVPGFTELPIVIDSLRTAFNVPIVDCNQAYAEYAIGYRELSPARPYKIGIIGGVGPAATVDFMDKIIHRTKAKRDQDHVKMVVEHNPQIPDRTENLIGDGPDPTIPLYSACKKLEAQGADMIAIPCNTAHAFVERIQRYLSIPVVNMLFETVEYIKRRHGDRRTVGLLATSGTVASRVYHDIIEAAGLDTVVPDPVHQDLVMRAIYGEKGVKAGYTEGECKQDLLRALENVVEQGADVVILGCTELPLLLQQTEDFPVAGKSVVVLDPTDILARKCVQLSRDEAA